MRDFSGADGQTELTSSDPRWIKDLTGVRTENSISKAQTKDDLTTIASSVLLAGLGFDCFAIVAGTETWELARVGLPETASQGLTKQGKLNRAHREASAPAILTNMPESQLALVTGERPETFDPSRVYSSFSYDQLANMAYLDPSGRVGRFSDVIRQTFGDVFPGFTVKLLQGAEEETVTAVRLYLFHLNGCYHDRNCDVLHTCREELDLFVRKIAQRLIQIHASAVGVLTEAERDVLRLLANGLTSKEIGAALNKATSTVSKQLESARRKLRAKNSTHAVAIALANHLLTPPTP